MAVAGVACTYERMKVALCPPAVNYFPVYFFSRYPQETTKMWNLLKLLTPTCWFCTFSSIISIIIMLKLFTLVGKFLRCNTSVQDITLVPFRYWVSFFWHNQKTIKSLL